MNRRDDTPIVQRGLRRERAAAYVGVSPAKFDAWVADKTMPPPRVKDGIVVWDIRELDAAFEELPHRGEETKADAWAGVQ